MYSIILKNGKTIIIKADSVSWDVENKVIEFFNRKEGHLVSVFNVDNIVGWINMNSMAESKNEEKYEGITEGHG